MRLTNWLRHHVRFPEPFPADNPSLGKTREERNRNIRLIGDRWLEREPKNERATFCATHAEAIARPMSSVNKIPFRVGTSAEAASLLRWARNSVRWGNTASPGLALRQCQYGGLDTDQAYQEAVAALHAALPWWWWAWRTVTRGFAGDNLLRKVIDIADYARGRPRQELIALFDQAIELAGAD